MTPLSWVRVTGCVVLVLLGILWTAQGLGVVHLAPIACLADCAPVEAPSTPWTVTGVIAVGIGLLGLSRPVRRR